MAHSLTNAGYTFADMAEEYEEQEEWHKAIEAHNEAAARFEQALLERPDFETRQQLEMLRKTHIQKAKELLDRNIFDTKKLDNIQKGDENSYAIVPTEEDDSEDPFNKFWGVVEPMVDKLSSPIVFTSTTANDADDSTSSTPIYYDTTNNLQETDRIQREMSSISESFFISPTMSKKEPNDSIDTQDNSIKSPKEENEELKATLLSLKNQIEELEKKSIDSTVLKSSIIQFKNDVHKQALRILQTQENSMMTRSATTTGSAYPKNIRHAGNSTAEIVNRIKDLEEANRTLRSQNRKQDALMNKYRERWEKLKEGAKKRQPSSAASTSTSNTNLLSALASHTPPSSINLTPSNK